jgi:hypothetical protein
MKRENVNPSGQHAERTFPLLGVTIRVLSHVGFRRVPPSWPTGSNLANIHDPVGTPLGPVIRAYLNQGKNCPPARMRGPRWCQEGDELLTNLSNI